MGILKIKDKILQLKGKQVEITYGNALDLPIKRKGNLVVDQDWAYVYDEGKSGNQYNGAFCLKTENDIKKIINIIEI